MKHVVDILSTLAVIFLVMMLGAVIFQPHLETGDKWGDTYRNGTCNKGLTPIEAKCVPMPDAGIHD